MTSTSEPSASCSITSRIVARPRGDECLMCYLLRVVEAFGCDTTLRWSKRWIRHQRTVHRRVGRLSSELRRRGGFCDCEVLMNVYGYRLPETPDRSRAPTPGSDGDAPPDCGLPTCAGPAGPTYTRRSARLWMSAAAASRPAALADVAAARRPHLGAAGEAERRVGRGALQHLEQLGRGVGSLRRVTHCRGLHSLLILLRCLGVSSRGRGRLGHGRRLPQRLHVDVNRLVDAGVELVCPLLGGVDAERRSGCRSRGGRARAAGKCSRPRSTPCARQGRPSCPTARTACW